MPLHEMRSQGKHTRESTAEAEELHVTLLPTPRMSAVLRTQDFIFGACKINYQISENVVMQVLTYPCNKLNCCTFATAYTVLTLLN